MDTTELDQLLDRIGRHHFRARFRLYARDRSAVSSHGMPTIRVHAKDLIHRRLAAAQPYKDGRQTPYRGHPVFIAQHATATCCRNCLQRWHGIQKGHALSTAEQAYVVDVITRWIERQLN
jgi:hypothetical protein